MPDQAKAWTKSLELRCRRNFSALTQVHGPRLYFKPKCQRPTGQAIESTGRANSGQRNAQDGCPFHIYEFDTVT
jgi:hypothetical protein